MSEQSAVEALKPCPHCGSDKIKTDYIRDGRVCGCCSCGASTRAYNPDAEVKAVQLWNTRALQAGGRPTPREGERPENPSLKAHINLVADKYRPLVNAEAGLLSALYDVDLLPEQLLHVLDVNPDAAAPNANRFMLICELWKLAHPPATPAPKASSEAEIERSEGGPSRDHALSASGDGGWSAVERWFGKPLSRFSVPGANAEGVHSIVAHFKDGDTISIASASLDACWDELMEEAKRRDQHPSPEADDHRSRDAINPSPSPEGGA